MGPILVMGGTTFVSRYLAEYLIGQGYIVDILTRGQTPVPYTGYREHLRSDRRSAEELEQILHGREYEYVFDITGYTRNDVALLLEALDTSKLRKYIFCSTCAVYESNEHPMRETDPRGLNPNWGTYGTDKLEAEDLLIDKFHSEGLPIVIFRPAYIYGEYNNLPRESFMWERIADQHTIWMPDEINKVQAQFIHISDLCRVFEAAMSHPSVGEAYNVSNPEPITWDYLIECCSKAAGQQAVTLPVPENQLRQDERSYFPFRNTSVVLDLTKLFTAGFPKPKLQLQEGLNQTYAWFRGA